MQIDKINDDSFKCILSKEDLEDRDLSLDDFVKNSDKVQELIHEVMEIAHEEFGFVANNDSVALRLMPLPDGQLKLVFTGSPESYLGSFFSELFKASGMPDPEMFRGKEVKSKQKEQTEEKTPECLVIGFRELDSLSDFAKRIISYSKRICADLYKSKEEFPYVLILGKKLVSKKNYEHIQNVVGDYGELLGTDELVASHVRELCELMIEKRAVRAMALI